jgi:hypothetical protein
MPTSTGTASTPLTAADFTLTNDTPTDVSDLNEALSYLSNSSNAQALLQNLEAAGTTINFDTNNGDSYAPATNTIDWDPTAAMVTSANNIVDGIDVGPGQGPVIGVNSPAICFAHEAAHATDPNLSTQLKQINWQYSSNAEQYAIQTEDSIDQQLGEVVRPNHFGSFMTVSDPTEHTITNNDGSMSLVQQGSNGAEITDGPYSAPPFKQPGILGDLFEEVYNVGAEFYTVIAGSGLSNPSIASAMSSGPLAGEGAGKQVDLSAAARSSTSPLTSGPSTPHTPFHMA